MKRREFIGLVAAGASGLVLSAVAGGREASASILAQPRLLDVLHDREIVRELGRQYRKNVPVEDDQAALARAILEQPKGMARLDDLRARVDEQVQRDFALGRTVKLKGWIVSVTEARQCALCSLLPA